MNQAQYTPEQIEIGLFLTQNTSERQNWAKKEDIVVTLEQCTRMLEKETSQFVRREWIWRKNFIYTPEQLENGLDKSTFILERGAWIKRQDYTPTKEQIRVGLNDKNELIREAWVKRLPKGAFTQKQLLKGLNDVRKVKLAWLNRNDIELSDEQIAKGLLLPQNQDELLAAYTIQAAIHQDRKLRTTAGTEMIKIKKQKL